MLPQCLDRTGAFAQVVAKFKETNGNVYCRLDYQRNLELYFLWLLSLVVFFSSVKMIRILRFNRRIGTLAATLKNAAGEMIGFAFVFGATSTAFNCALYIVLFSKVEEYRTYLSLMETTFSAMLGKFSFDTVVQASTFAGIIFVTYMCMTTILLLNLFIMVLMAVFEEVHADALKQTNDYEVMDHLYKKVPLGCCQTSRKQRSLGFNSVWTLQTAPHHADWSDQYP
uniref:Polycystin cation channel PKD1/PKD2 domain-containing protein n=1 Tax=Plectus sambesii TaxID=2011161 RepID=A0A914XFD3_9BILA